MRWQRRPRCATPPSRERKRGDSSSPAKKRARKASPSPALKSKSTPRSVLTTPVGRGAAPDSPPTKAKNRNKGVVRSIALNEHMPEVPAKLFSSPVRDIGGGGVIDRLSNACLTFLTNPDLSLLQEHYRELCGYLARDAEYGFIGGFLLSGCMTDMFARTLHMRHLVRNAIHHRFNVQVSSMYELSTIANNPGFAAMDGASKQALQLISYCFDSEQKRTPLFSLVEPVKRAEVTDPFQGLF